MNMVSTTTWKSRIKEEGNTGIPKPVKCATNADPTWRDSWIQGQQITEDGINNRNQHLRHRGTKSLQHTFPFVFLPFSLHTLGHHVTHPAITILHCFQSNNLTIPLSTTTNTLCPLVSLQPWTIICCSISTFRHYRTSSMAVIDYISL